jgi:hypothetical protein
MKKVFLLAGFCAFMISCSDEDNNNTDTLPPVSGNKVLALKVDLLTNTFAGGKELEFEDADAFSIAVNYNPPGDFGDVALSYAEVQQPLFAGTIIWMGTGAISYPDFEPASAFESSEGEAALPANEDFALIANVEGEAAPWQSLDYAEIWDAIDNLVAVKAYRQANPGAEVKLYLYTPSVGIGNPAEWDWIVFIKN